MALVDTAVDLFGLPGKSSPSASRSLSTSSRVAMASLLDSPLPPSACLPPAQPQALPPIKHARVGCAAGSDTKTVFVTGDFLGDSTRLDVVMEQSRRTAAAASKRGNRVVYAFMGNVVPDLHPSSKLGDAADSVTRVLSMAANGIQLEDSAGVSPEDVLLISGPKELAWLRLANPNSKSREVARHTDENVRDVLVRGTPVLNSETPNEKAPAFQKYNQSLKLFGEVEEEGLGVAMMLKMVSMAHMTMGSVGIARTFLERLQKLDSIDAASVSALITFVSSFHGTVEEGIVKLFDGGKLTPEGLGVRPAAVALVDEVLKFATYVAAEYTRSSKLVCCVVNGGSSDPDHGLWLTPEGLDYAVGRLPSGVDESGARVTWKRGPENSIEWSEELNRMFVRFVDVFLKGDDSMPVNLYRAFVMLSVDTVSKALPLESLRTNIKTCSGATSSKSFPFGTVQRRILVKPTSRDNHSNIIKVLEQWTTTNTNEYTPSTYWSVATWCGSTKADLTPVAPSLNFNVKLKDLLRSVSVVWASILTARINGCSVSDHGVSGLQGILGPVLVHQKQPMRVAAFLHEEFDNAFVVLLPEVYVQWSLDYLGDDLEHATSRTAPMLATEGFLSLPDDAIVPLGYPGIDQAEVEALRAELGSRVWSLPKRRSCKHNTAFSSTDYAATDFMKNFKPDTPKHTSPGFTVYHTLQSSEDVLAGVRVSLSPVPGFPDRMTITPCSGRLHALYRVVAIVK